MDKQKIVKLLSLTQSDNDNEALSAIRMANKILRANEMTWDKFIGPPGFSQEKNYSWAPYQNISEKLEYILNNYPLWFNPEFIRDLSVQLKVRGKLTPKQVQAVEKIYHKLFAT